MTENFIENQNQEMKTKISSNSSILKSSTGISGDNKNKSSSTGHISKPQSKRVIYIGETDTIPESNTSKLNKATKKLKKLIKTDKRASKGSIIKNRKFRLNPKPFTNLTTEEKQIITKLPVEYKDFLRAAQNLCHTENNFCYELFKPTKKPYYKFFKKNGLIFPNITKETAEYPTLCYKFLQNYAHRFLLSSFYNDGRFSELYNKVSEYFKEISDNPFTISRFKGTSNIHINKTFIIGNKVFIDKLSEEDEINNWQITATIKYVVINSVYFAYRDKIIKNIWFQLLSYNFRFNSLVSKEDLENFLLNKEISNSLARRLYRQLIYDVNGILRGWKGRKPTWQQFLNELRCFRKNFCNELLTNNEIQDFIEKTNQKMTFQTISEVLYVVAEDKAPKTNLTKDFVDQFIVYCKETSKYQFKRMFNHYFLGEPKKTKKLRKGKKNNSDRFKNYDLFQEFLAEATSEFLKEKILAIEQLSSANTLWKKMVDSKTGKHYIHELLLKSKLQWQQLLEKVDLKQLYQDRLKLWLKRFEEEFILEKQNYSQEAGDLFNEIENNNENEIKLNKRVVIQKRKDIIGKNPSKAKNNLKFFRKRRAVPSMIPSSFNNQATSNLESELFDKTFSVTPYKEKTENYYSKENNNFQKIIPCFESYIRSVIDKNIEERMRESFTRNKSKVLLNLLKKEQKKIKYPNPVFRNFNFSTGPANKQLFELDLENRQFSVCLFKRSSKRSIWYNFIIQDEDTPENQRIYESKKRLEQKFYNLELEEYPSNLKLRKKKRVKEPRLNKFLNVKADNGSSWKVRNPKVVYDFQEQEFSLHIPFEKIIADNKSFNKILSKNTNIPLNKTVKEIVIGIDQGISWYAVVSVDYIVSKYSKNKEGKIIREIISREPLRHYYLNDLEVFGSTFDKKTGLFNNGSFTDSGEFIKRKTNNLWGKGRFRVLKSKIRKRQRYLSYQQNQKLTEGSPSKQFSYHSYSNDLLLKSYWKKFQNLQKTLATNLAGKIRDISVYFQTVFRNENPSYRDCFIRVQVEYLKWVTYKPKYKVGYFLSHNNIHFIYSQFQESVSNLLLDHSIGLWAVNPRDSSNLCSLCDYPEIGFRTGKNFYCSNPEHKIKNNKSYSCNADLNAARNISLFPPLSLKAMNLAKN